MNKIIAFIDGPNLYAACKALDVQFDYAKLLAWLRGRGDLVRALYYTAMKDNNEMDPVRPMADWLQYNGYVLVTKPTKQFVDQNTGRTTNKGNMDVDIAVDMMEMADRCDHVYLFSGDGDFRPLVQAVQRKGVRVTVVSTMESETVYVADELRRQADEFVDLDGLQPLMKPEQVRKTPLKEYA